MKAKLVSVIAMLLVSVMSYAQIEGVVRMADNKPATYATVALYKDAKTNSAPIKYAVTDKNGHFILSGNAVSGQYLVIRYVGYKEYRLELKDNQTNIAVTLELDGKGNLNEVTVKSTYTGIQVKGDTIAFDTEHFKTGEEETVSDVLKKLPGMEVSDNGEVSFAGKAVDKVLVDGKDMFSSGSDGVINNLSADELKGAEILKNYKTGSLIDDFRTQELTALNLKTDGKIKITGKLSAMGGVKNKAKFDGNVLYMGEKAYITSVLSANNTGQAVFSFHDYMKNIIGLDNLLSRGSKGFRGFSAEDAALLFPPQNVYKSNNGLWSLSGTYKPSDKLKVQGSLITNASKMNAETLSEQLYTLFEQKNTHSLINENTNKFFSANLREKYKISENIELSNLTQFSLTSLNADDSLSEKGLTDMFARQNTDMTKRNFQEEAAVNIKQGNGLWSVHLMFDNTYRNYSYDLLTDRNILPVDYNLISDTSYALNTGRKINNTKFSPDITYAYSLSDNYKLQTTLSFNYNNNTFNYNDLTDRTDQTLTWKDYSAMILLSKNKGFFRFSAGAELRNTAWNSTIKNLEKGNYLTVLPSASLSLNFSSSHSLSLTANMDNSPIEMEYLLKTRIINDYSSLYEGSQITSPFLKSKNLNLNYHYYNGYYNTMFFASAGYSDSETTKAGTMQDSSIVTRTTYTNDGHIISKNVMTSVTQGLGFIPVDAELSANISSSSSETVLNKEKDNINSLSYAVDIGFTSRMKKLINFRISANYSHSGYSYDISDITNSMDEKGSRAALIFVYKDFKANIRGSYSYLDNSQNNKNYFDLGFRAEYKIKQWRIHIQGNNILNVKNMDWLSISATPMYTSSTYFRKIPGYILAGLSYRF